MTDIVEWLRRHADCHPDDKVLYEGDGLSKHLSEAATEITRLQAIEAVLLEPTEEIIEIVAGAIWGGRRPEQYKMSDFMIGRARAVIKVIGKLSKLTWSAQVQ